MSPPVASSLDSLSDLLARRRRLEQDLLLLEHEILGLTGALMLRAKAATATAIPFDIPADLPPVVSRYLNRRREKVENLPPGWPVAIS